MMVKRRINTIFGVICVIIIIVIVSIVSRQLYPTKNTAGSANTDPQATQATQNNPLPSSTTSEHNNQLLGAFIGTSRTQLPHHHPHHGNTAPSSDAGATILAPKPGNGTIDTGGL
eukprot:1098616-Ditylum_brightwellii.AAC.1